MPITGPVPEWLLSAVAAATLFTVMFDVGLAVVPSEFKVPDSELERDSQRRARAARRDTQ